MLSSTSNEDKKLWLEEKSHLRSKEEQLRSKEEQLRRKEEQLRRKEEQLREEKTVLMKNGIYSGMCKYNNIYLLYIYICVCR